MKLIVLLSTYNGEKYLKQQLDSLINQDLQPFEILIRDDGSSDQTINILKHYSRQYQNIHYYCGENKGPAKSFWHLIRDCEEADYYALCDQDDVWFKDKLSTAINCLDKEDLSIPLLYASKYTLTDRDLHPLNSNVSKLYNFSDFPHSLIYHSAPGCTFVFNHEARKRILEYDLDQEYHLIHDAIIHKVVCLFGKMVLDPSSHMYYRQHGNNEIGMNANKIKVFLGRIKRFVGGKSKHYRSNTAKFLLKVYGEKCSKENRHLLDVVANYQEIPAYKKELLSSPCFKSGTINDLFFQILVRANYI